jgi:hypothetical protein
MHKRYSVFVRMDEAGNTQPALRRDHDRDLLRKFLHSLPPESSVAIETMGSWYRLVDEVEYKVRPRNTLLCIAYQFEFIG